MARNLVAKGAAPLLFDRCGAVALCSAEHLDDMAGCEVLLLCLPDGRVVHETLRQLAPNMRPGWGR